MYLYRANAVGLAGFITRPVQEVIENQAAASLANIGGMGRARIGNYELRGIVSVRQAFAETAGAFDSNARTYSTSARVTVEGLNVLDVVTADRVVARLTSEYREGDVEPRILVAGSHFENLRILGEPVNAGVNTRFFDENDTFERFVYGSSRVPEGPFRNWGGVDHPAAVYSGSLLEQVPLQPDVNVQQRGSVIRIPNFGRIYLAEFFLQPSHRQLNMIRLELGSPVAGSLVIASASCGGLAGDPGKDDD